MTVAHVDFETYCELNLPKVGLFKYSEHPSLEIHVVGFAIDDEDVELWIPSNPSPKIKLEIFQAVGVHIHWGKKCPEALKNASQYRAHNAQFERVIGNSHAGRKIRFPKTDVTQWVCTAAKAAASNIPRKLEDAAKALGLRHQKDTTNSGSMLKLAKPRRPSKNDPRTRWTYENAFGDYIKMYKYNVDDVRTERELDQTLPDLSPREQRLYELDQQINERGIRVDRDAIGDVLFLVADYKARIAKNCIRITGVKPTQRDKLVEWLRNKGADLPNMQADTVRDWLTTEDNTLVRKVLRIYQSYNMKAPSKYDKMLLAACSDDRLRGMFLYHGAATGRWASLIVQLQNLFRGVLPDPNNAIALYETMDLDFLMMLYSENPMQIFASTIRGMLVPEDGKILRCADYNSIEGRVTAWLAGQEDKLDIYRTHGKVYEHTAAQIFGMPNDVDSLKRMKEEHPDERFAGKTAELALGFQGAVDALNRMAKKEGKEFEIEFALQIVRAWRESNNHYKKLWRNLEEHAHAAVENPGQVFKTNKLMFKVEGDFLYMRLPSGRRLAYYKPDIRDGKYGPQVTYMGVDTTTRRYGRVSSYGGRWTENAAQGTARDIMAHALPNLEKAGYNVIGTVHDEVIDEDDPEFGSLEEMCEIMCDTPKWAEGLPVAADGWEGLRYKKD